MNKLETLQKENKNLKDLLEEVYEMSCLDDMINDLRSGEDDEMLLCNLSLKSQIMEALGKRQVAKELKPLMTEASLKLTKHNGSKVLADHYLQPKKSEEVKS
jgi:hypothetical protein